MYEERAENLRTEMKSVFSKTPLIVSLQNAEISNAQIRVIESELWRESKMQYRYCTSRDLYMCCTRKGRGIQKLKIEKQKQAFLQTNAAPGLRLHKIFIHKRERVE